MIEGYHPLVQALLGGLLTWGLTALGAAAVYAPFHTQNKKLLDASLGFAAGVMTAASFWSLLAPGIERAEETMAKWAFLPIGCGFFCGALFVYGADVVLPFLGFSSEDMVAAFLAKQDLPVPNPAVNNRASERAFEKAQQRSRSRSSDAKLKEGAQRAPPRDRVSECSYRTAVDTTPALGRLKSGRDDGATEKLQPTIPLTAQLQQGTTTDPDQLQLQPPANGEVRHRGRPQHRSRGADDDASSSTRRVVALQVPTAAAAAGSNNTSSDDADSARALCEQAALSWRRVLLLIIAITVHNIPEGLAVGVAFGAIGKARSATFESAISLALGIGIQNFPEGMAVSLPLVGFGYSRTRAFFYGQLSGMVEPISAMVGAAIVTWAEPALPYALSFAAGAMIYVVFDDIVPEAQLHGNGRLASWTAIVGFIVMMSLDVSLG